MWYVTTYRLVSPISLKLSTATSTGGKSLLLPTPFAVKMALLDCALQDAGGAEASAVWEELRGATVAIRGPERITVNNTFTKVMKPARGQPEVDPDTGLIPPMNRSIAFREYVWWEGDCRLAVDLRDGARFAWAAWMTRLSYIGKRGGFIQALAPPTVVETLDVSFTNLCVTPATIQLHGTLQIMDDCGPETTFEQVDVYSAKPLRLGKDRILRHVVLPYRVERSSRSYTLYRRLA